VSEFIPTSEQKAILSHRPGRHARILAGPGTGKSATLVALLDLLLTEKAAIKLKLLTFTRAATSELARKVSEHPAAVLGRPSTVHSFAISILLRNPGAGDLPQPLRIADDWEYHSVVRWSLGKRVGVSAKTIDRLVTELAANWQSLKPEEDPRVDSKDRSRFLGAWNEDREILGYTLLGELPYALKNSLQNYVDLEGVDYDLLIVDEYQDLNACDLELLRLISERGCSVVGAGDDDQSIYNFRKAAPEGIRRFLEDYPGAADYALSITQRCGRDIVEWANYVICGDPDRPKSRQSLIPADSCPAGECALLSFANEVEEAESIALLVQKLTGNVPPSEILVLLRGDHNGAFSKPLKEALTKLNIPFSDPDAVRRMLEEPDNRQLIEVLRLLVNREDSLSWASILVLADGVGPAFFEYIYGLAREMRQRFGRALLDAYARDFSGGPTSSAAKAQRLIKEILKWVDAKSAEKKKDGEGCGAWILRTAKGGIAPAPSKDLAELLLAMDDLVEEEQGLGRYLSQIAPLGRDRAQAESKGVRIMTMGGAKGLTVEATIVMAAETGVIPRPDCEIAEERRLLYVAMTRAKRYLFVTWARRRKGPTARAGAGARERRVGVYRRYSHFLDDGPVKSQEGTGFIRYFSD